MNELSLIYSTWPNTQTAENMASKLLEKKQIACANILPSMTSLYEWQGQIEKSAEVVMLIKTVTTNVESVKKMIVEDHEYECPCVVAWVLDSAHNEFAQWVSEQTR
ncbi:MAG: divalent-cation tolerance protein CutA [Bdellovibrionaceae bacterium]|nr:divalent-cation tolerance protein CutA [Pseudobdellovibrionaceae bacterium]|tara:strand:- start:286 stop:603 length:318 start_codon:yes stop_codon:yes gene_type:complete